VNHGQTVNVLGQAGSASTPLYSATPVGAGAQLLPSAPLPAGQAEPFLRGVGLGPMSSTGETGHCLELLVSARPWRGHEQATRAEEAAHRVPVESFPVSSRTASARQSVTSCRAASAVATVGVEDPFLSISVG